MWLSHVKFQLKTINFDDMCKCSAVILDFYFKFRKVVEQHS